MRTPVRFVTLVGASVAVYACVDRVEKVSAPPSSPSATSQTSTSPVPAPLQQGGCAASAPDAQGTERAMVIPSRLLPFKVRPLQRNPRTGRDDGRGVRIRTKTPDGVPVTLNCLLPQSVTVQDLTTAIKNSNQSRWRGVFKHLPKARPVPDPEILQASTPPARSDASNPAALPDTAFSSNCVEVSISFWYEGSNGWFYIKIEFIICDEPGGGDAWGHVIPYANYPYVFVDADKYQITQLDTVRFWAEIYNPNATIPILQGWVWNHAAGRPDPWTQACSDLSYACRIGIHGSGTMSFNVDIDGIPLSASVNIGAFPPPDVGDEEGDVDEPLPDIREEPEAERSSGPFAIETNAFLSTEVTLSQSIAIFVYAVQMGEWHYTQGCYHCAGGPNTEPAKNLAAQYGDCTDFVWAAINGSLGSSVWNPPILRTRGFNNSSTATLANYGYVEIASSSARPGDVVVRTKTDPASCMCGHAGLFGGWGASDDGGSHYPIGWANNGLPAKPTRPNVDLATNVYHFREKAGMVTKYFRPVVP